MELSSTLYDDCSRHSICRLELSCKIHYTPITNNTSNMFMYSYHEYITGILSFNETYLTTTIACFYITIWKLKTPDNSTYFSRSNKRNKIISKHHKRQRNSSCKSCKSPFRRHRTRVSRGHSTEEKQIIAIKKRLTFLPKGANQSQKYLVHLLFVFRQSKSSLKSFIAVCVDPA